MADLQKNVNACKNILERDRMIDQTVENSAIEAILADAEKKMMSYLINMVSMSQEQGSLEKINYCLELNK